MNYNEFYSNVSRGFGAPGSAYTIVLGRHIGTDFPAPGGTIVPALRAGTVVAVVKTVQMAWGVITYIGNDLYASYWHLSAIGLPRVGTHLALGARVGRLARGYVPYGHPEYAGTAWSGPHCHVVIGTHMASAYSMVGGHRTLGAFRDPEKHIVRPGSPEGSSSGESSTDDGSVPAPVTPKSLQGEGQMREYYRHNQTKEVVVVTGREMVSVGYDDLAVLLKIDAINHERNPQVYPKPPVLDKPDTYFGLNEDGWALLKAFYPYRARN